QDEQRVETLLHDIPVDLDGRCRKARRRIGGDRDDGASARDRLPAGSRQAIQRRVDALALTLALVIPDVQADLCPILLADVDAIQVLGDPEYRDDLRVELDRAGTLPPVDLRRERGERRP